MVTADRPLVPTDDMEQTNEGNETIGCAPSFEQLLGDLMANEGDIVELKCKVVGDPVPTIKWFLSNHELFQSEHIQFGHADHDVKLTLNGVTQNDRGVYTVYATNSHGEAKCFSQLIVKSINVADSLIVAEHPIVVQALPIDKTEPNKPMPDISSNVIKTPNGAPHLFQQHSHIKEYSTESSSVRIEKQSTITSKTTELHASHSDGVALQGSTMDKHSCVAIHSALESAEPAIVDQSIAQPIEKVVVKPQKRSTAPRFISPFVGKIVTQGANVTLEAVFDGHPEPSIDLTQNDAPLIHSDKVQITRQPNKIIITLTDVTCKDAGRYTCTATNTNGNAVSTADVVVKSK